MTKQEVIDILEYHNRWRKGEDIPMLEPKGITFALDEALKYLNNENNS